MGVMVLMVMVGLVDTMDMDTCWDMARGLLMLPLWQMLKLKLTLGICIVAFIMVMVMVVWVMVDFMDTMEMDTCWDMARDLLMLPL